MLLGAKMKFYVLRMVVWLPNQIRQTNQPKRIKPFLLRISYAIFSSNVMTNYLKNVEKLGIILR
jgi:hypothetical protein